MTENKRNKSLLVIGILILLLTVIGATYAYFSVTTVNNFGTSTINATAGPIGSVTLNGNNAQLNLNVTALDMVQGENDVVYYAGTNGTITTPTTVTLGTATVSPNTDTNNYHCTYTLSVTHSGTNDMYTAFINGANKSAGQIILTINGVDYDFYDGWPTNNQINGDFYINKDFPQNITAGLRLINDSDINQNYLAGSDIQISISLVTGSLSCEVSSSKPFIAAGTDSTTGFSVVRHKYLPSEEFYVLNNDIDYSSLVSSYGNLFNYAADKSILFSKYNLYVGKIYENNGATYTEIPTTDSNYGLQSADARGYRGRKYSWIGTVPFSGSSTQAGYWYDSSSNTIKSKYGIYSSSKNNIYDTDYVAAPNWSTSFYGDAGNANYSIAYYVEEYVDRLGVEAVGRLLTYGEARSLTTTKLENRSYYWLATAWSNYNVYFVWMNGQTLPEADSTDMQGRFYDDRYCGVRPVIVIDTSDIETS